MNKLITLEQVNLILKVLGEVPAKISFDAINVLVNLPDHDHFIPDNKES